MTTSRRALLAGAAAFAAAGCGWGRDDVTRAGAAAFDRGAAWLGSRQRPDGAFPSATYGFMRAGHSLTGLALHALAARGPRPDLTGLAHRGCRFLVGAATGGGLGLGGPAVDYPVYATSLAVLALVDWRPDAWQVDAATMAGWLRGQQLVAGRGWEGHPARGGFPLGGPASLSGPSPVHVDLSITRHAAQALRALGAEAADPALAEALAFVRRCRTPAAAFVYDPTEPAANKGPPEGGPEGDPGYGTATADGVLALIACGGTATEIQAGAAALAGMHTPSRNPRVGGEKQVFAEGMKGYYRAVAGAAFAAVGGPPGWARLLVEAVVADQGPDGSWRNENPVQKEDDPVIATSLALLALGAALGPDGGG